MGFLRLLLKSIIYGTLLVFLSIAFFVVYQHFAHSVAPDASSWNPNVRITMEGIRFSFVKTNGINLNVLEAGPEDGIPVFLLHGFPESALLSWHGQIQPLVAKGYHVIAPDLRGYNTSDKPDAIADYNIFAIVDDVIGLFDHFNVRKANLVGHDWGGLIAWMLAMKYPERVERLAVLNIPHPKAFDDYMTSSLSQLSKSWYIFYFNLPFFPEAKITRKSDVMLFPLLLSTAIPGKTFSIDSHALYLQSWNEPNAITSMLNWYRALMQARPKELPDPTVKLPVLILFGKKDIAISHQIIEESRQYLTNAKVIYYEDATHWVQHDAKEEVNEQLLEWLPSPPAVDSGENAKNS